MSTKMNFIEKEATIYSLMSNGKNSRAIAEITGLTHSTVIHVIDKLMRYEKFAPMDEYFIMSYDLYSLIKDNGGNADHQLSVVLSALWFSGITKRTKLKMMSNADFAEFCETKKMRRAGKACIKALTDYKAILKRTKLGK